MGWSAVFDCVISWSYSLNFRSRSNMEEVPFQFLVSVMKDQVKLLIHNDLITVFHRQLEVCYCHYILPAVLGESEHQRYFKLLIFSNSF